MNPQSSSICICIFIFVYLYLCICIFVILCLHYDGFGPSSAPPPWRHPILLSPPSEADQLTPLTKHEGRPAFLCIGVWTLARLILCQMKATIFTMILIIFSQPCLSLVVMASLAAGSHIQVRWSWSFLIFKFYFNFSPL